MARPHFDIGPLAPATAQAVRGLAADAERADGVAPLGEQTLLLLESRAADVTHIVVFAGGGDAHDNGHGTDNAAEVIGYAQVDRSGQVASVEIVVAANHRRKGIGRKLLRTARRDATLPSHSGEPSGLPLRVWAHGNLPAARALATGEGLEPLRELLFLSRPVGPADMTDAELPAGVRLRAFRPGIDDAAWLAVNAEAFATHPEQGRFAEADLAARMAEPWFDPAGFLLAWDGDAIAGFVWTKIADPAEGEIYVVGVDPAHQGRRLGHALTAAGISHIARSGASRVTLYVDGDNTAALRTYDRAGFVRAGIDVQYGPATTSS